MPNEYRSLFGETVTTKIIEKSKFITTSRHVCGEEEAHAFIEGVSKKYRDATHNCYAYIADNLGNFPRFSDDGEPQGTAGMPMLEAIKNNGLYEVCVVVTRYFGGIKLGAGGLVRAYSGSVAQNIAAAQKVVYRMCSQSLYIFGYPHADAALRFFAGHGADIISTEYLNDVRVTAAVNKDDEEAFNAALVNYLNGKVVINKLKEYYFPFKI